MKIYFLLTEKCNLRCKMCIRGKKQNSEICISDLEQFDILNSFKNHDIVITGGEPTLCKDFKKIVHAIAKTAKSVSICTNGTINDYIERDFFNPNISIQISIDGSLPFHNKIRGNGMYEKSFETIKKLEDLGLPYRIATVVNKTNQESIGDLVTVLSDLKYMSWWNMSMEMPFGEGSFSEMLQVEEWNDFVDKLLAYVPFKVKTRKLFPFELFDKHKVQLDLMSQKGLLCTNCGSGKNKIYVYPDLTVFPCTCLTDFPLGNLKENTLFQIMKDKKTEAFSNYTVSDKSKCKECEYLKYCNGGCMGMSYRYFGELGMGDIRCPKLRESK